MTLVIVPGTFDGVHDGHRELFSFAQKIAGSDGEVWVLVNSDDMITKRKNIALLMDQHSRCNTIKELHKDFFVNIVESIDELKDIYKLTRPTVIHGDDYTIESLSRLYGVDTHWWLENDVLPIFCHRNTGVSSTILRNQKNEEK